MRYKINESDIAILKTSGVSENDIKHCVKVAEKALDIAQRTGANLDMELVCRAHCSTTSAKRRPTRSSTGRSAPSWVSSSGSRPITDIMEKHIRGGLTEAEAIELSLPVKDYTLRKLEERIVIYADRLVDILMDGIVILQSEKEAEDRFEEILMTIPKYGKNEITLNRYLGYHREIQGLMRK